MRLGNLLLELQDETNLLGQENGEAVQRDLDKAFQCSVRRDRTPNMCMEKAAGRSSIYLQGYVV